MHAQVDKERFCRNKPKKRYSEFVKLMLHCGRLAEKKIGQKKKKHASPSDHPDVICALMQQLVLVSQKAEAVAVMLRASHIPLYGLSVGEPEELSGLILSLESTCQDLFGTGYFESDISDDPLTLG